MNTDRQVLAVGAAIDHRMSLEEAIQEFVRIQTRYSELAEEKRRVMEVLVPAAFEVRGQTNTTRLSNHDGSVQLKCEFLTDYKCEQSELNTVRDLLGDDVFEQYFNVTYKPRMRELKTWLSSRSTDETVETAKEMVRKAVKRQDLSPRLTVEKGAVKAPWDLA